MGGRLQPLWAKYAVYVGVSYHALFVGYAPYENPEISIATRIAYGYTSGNAAGVSKNILSVYFGKQTLDEILALKAQGVNSSLSNTITD